MQWKTPGKAKELGGDGRENDTGEVIQVSSLSPQNSSETPQKDHFAKFLAALEPQTVSTVDPGMQ